MKDCQQRKRITGSVQEKNGCYYIVVNLYVDGKRKPKWMPTGLPVKGYNKRKADAMLDEALFAANHGNSIESPQPHKSVDLMCCDRQEPDTSHPQERLTSGFPGGTIHLVDYLEQWMNRMKHMVKANTWAGYKRNMDNWIMPYFKQHNFILSALEPYHVQAFYDHCLTAPKKDGSKGTLSSSSLRRIHAVMSKAMNDAVFTRIIKSSPVTAVITPPNNKYTAKYHNTEQVMKFLDAAKGDLCEVPLFIMVYFGLRRSEALGLKIDAIDFETNRLSIQHTVVLSDSELLCLDITKTKKSRRTLPIMSEMVPYLQDVVKKVEGLQALFGPSFNPQGYICIKNDGDLLFPTTVSKHYKLVCERAGLPVNRLHDSRHTNASILVKSGCNMKEIQRWLGHSDIATTGNLYSHLEVDDLKNASSTISGKIPFLKADRAEPGKAAS